ncbi:ABC transporter transmembrane region family protein, partial [Vibrio harveyi]
MYCFSFRSKIPLVNSLIRSII